MKWSNFSTVNDLMAVLAERHTIGDFISEVWVIFPLFYVVGVYFVACPAFLASIIISSVNIFSPFLVFVSASLFACWLSGCLALALSRTISFVDMPRSKVFSTIPTRDNPSRVFDLIAHIRTIKPAKTFDRFSASPAFFRPTIVAEETKRLTGNKSDTAFFAPKIVDFPFRLIRAFIAKIGVFFCRLSAMLTSVTTMFAFLLGITFRCELIFATDTSFHVAILPQLQRMADAFPGIEIRKLE